MIEPFAKILVPLLAKLENDNLQKEASARKGKNIGQAR